MGAEQPCGWQHPYPALKVIVEYLAGTVRIAESTAAEEVARLQIAIAAAYTIIRGTFFSREMV